jgi:phosphoserine phosphatase RsbU/P
MASWRVIQQSFWNEISPTAYVTFAAAVAVTFASIGFLTDLTSLERPFSNALYGAVLGGLCAALFFFALTRGFRWIPVAVLFQLGMSFFLSGPARRAPWAGFVGLPIDQRLRYDMLGAMLCVIFGYTGFVLFIGREGRRWVSLHAEMRLAHEIHQTLVPPIARTHGRFEFHGVSLPSGQVGGDLVDLVALPDGRWIGYVADVTGHGVSSGLLMGMVKSAVRMRVNDWPPLPVLVTELNRLIHDQTPAHMFVTFAAVRGGGGAEDGTLELTLCGHPPILRVRPGASSSAASVEAIGAAHVPLGIAPEWTFDSVTMTCEPGDLLAVVTDGLFEVFDARDQDFGFDGIKTLIASMADRPLTEIADSVLARVRAFGPQLDDQTLLLVRYGDTDVHHT